MICANCQSVNLEDANFCWKCGYRISLICSRCSRRVAGHAVFCDGCGYGIAGQVHNAQGSQVEMRPAEQQRPVAPPIPMATPADGGAPQTPVTPPSAPLTSEPVPVQVPHPQIETPPTVTHESAESGAPQPVAADSPLAQYIPAELMTKLENARSSGDMVSFRVILISYQA